MKYILILLSTLILASCAPTYEDLNYSAKARFKTEDGIRVGDSETGISTNPSFVPVSVSMSETIWVDPPSSANPSIYIRVRDISGADLMSLDNYIKKSFNKRGYQVVNNGGEADYTLEATIKDASERSLAEIQQLDETEYGNSLTNSVAAGLRGAQTGAVLGSIIGDDAKGIGIGAGIGAIFNVGSNIVDNNEKQRKLLAKQSTKHYAIVVDIRVGQRPQDGKRVQRSRRQTDNTDLDRSKGEGLITGESVGSSSTNRDRVTQNTNDTSAFGYSKARLVAKTKGKLTAFGDVKNDMLEKIARSIDGLF